MTFINYDGAGAREPDEYVEIKNFDTNPVQLENWSLQDAANHEFTFSFFKMESGKVCRVYTNEIHTAWCGFSYDSGSVNWNNSGDYAD